MCPSTTKIYILKKKKKERKSLPQREGSSLWLARVLFRAGPWERSKGDRLFRETSFQQGNLTCFSSPMKKLLVYNTYQYYLQCALFSHFSLFQWVRNHAVEGPLFCFEGMLGTFGLGEDLERCWHPCDPPSGCVNQRPGPVSSLCTLPLLCFVSSVLMRRMNCLCLGS